jgi:hypothetical protein
MAVHLISVSVKGFKKCCISNGMNRTDEIMLWNDSEEDGNVRNEHEKDEGTNCDDGDSDND